MRYSVSLSSNNNHSEECQRKGPPRVFHRRRGPLVFRILVPTYYDPASFFSKTFPSSPSPLLPIFRILYEPRRPIIFLPSLSRSFSSGYYETRFQRWGRGMAEERRGAREEAVENVGRVPARHCHFHRLAAFPRLSSTYPPFLAAVSYHPREKPTAMKIRCSLFAAKRTSDIRLWVFRIFGTSRDRERDRIARDDRESNRIVQALLLKINIL